MSHHEDIPVQEISQLLDVVSEKIPTLVRELKSSLFSAEAGQELGKAVGAFYKELVAAGIPEGQALDMAKSYIGSLQGMMNQLKSH